MPTVVAFGDINLDIIAHVPRYPQPGGGSLASKFVVKGGGSAANMVRALAYCSISVRLIGRVGNDAIGEQLLAELSAIGVDVSPVQHDREVASGVMFTAITPDGRRTVFGYRGANARTSAYELQPDIIRTADWLHLSGYALIESPQSGAALRTLAIASTSGVRISLDLGPEIVLRESRLVDMLLPHVRVLFPNREEAQALTGAGEPATMIAALHKKGVPIVALKLGEEGCVIGYQDELYRVPAFAVKAVDATGAGDAFAAGFLAACIHGLDMRTRGLWANALGAIATSVEGGAIPSREAICSFLRECSHHRRWSGWEDEFAAILSHLERPR